MQNNNESKANSLQMVEIDHSKFAVKVLTGNVSVNLTTMGKPFGQLKRPEQWLRTQEAQDYVKAMSDALKCASADLLIVKKGGIPGNQGTWANDRRIALRYAQWLSPHFSIMVDEAILNLMITGNPDTERPKQLTTGTRNHNRLTRERMIDILADVALIEQRDIRERLVSKLMAKGGQA